MKCYTPTDNSIVSDSVHVALDRDVDDAVRAARRSQPGWAATPPASKAKIMLAVADRIEAMSDEFARLEALCSGKPVSNAKYEVPLAAAVFRCASFKQSLATYYDSHADGHLQTTLVLRTSWLAIRFQRIMAMFASFSGLPLVSAPVSTLSTARLYPLHLRLHLAWQRGTPWC